MLGCLDDDWLGHSSRVVGVARGVDIKGLFKLLICGPAFCPKRTGFKQEFSFRLKVARTSEITNGPDYVEINNAKQQERSD